jgi:hypothetical protein
MLRSRRPREALTGYFDDHHGFICRMTLDNIDRLCPPGIDTLSAKIDEQIAPNQLQVHHAGPGDRHRPDLRPGTHRRARRGHEPVPHFPPLGLLGAVLPPTETVGRPGDDGTNESDTGETRRDTGPVNPAAVAVYVLFGIIALATYGSGGAWFWVGLLLVLASATGLLAYAWTRYAAARRCRGRPPT